MKQPNQIRSIVAVDLSPRDVIVIELKGQNLPLQRINALREAVDTLWPNNPCLILDEGQKFTIVTPVDDDAPAEGHA